MKRNLQTTIKAKVLIVAAMDTEIDPLISHLQKIESSTILNFYPLMKCVYDNVALYILKTYVGDVNASAAGLAAIEQIDPDFVVKFGTVGGSYLESKMGDIIVPLGFFHRAGWITKDKKSHKPTSNASRWDSVFGEKDYQIQESRHNLGGMPYYFPTDSSLRKTCINTLKLLRMKYQTAYVGGGNMWMFDKNVLNNVATSMLPKSKTHNRFVSDMESYSLAHICYLTHKPFVGCYVVASNDYINQEYNPLIVSEQMSNIVPYVLKLATNLAL